MQDHKLFKYFRPELNKYEDVKPQRWRWIALYNDDSRLYQFDLSDATFHQLREIDQTKLKAFIMYSLKTSFRVVLEFDPRRHKLNHFLRKGRIAREKGFYYYTWYMFGIKDKGNEKLSKYIKIDEFDNVILLKSSPLKD